VANGERRRVLFFSVRPLYPSTLYHSPSQADAYDDDAQVHAGWVLYHARSCLPPAKRREVFKNYARHGYQMEPFYEATRASDPARKARKKAPK